MEEKLNFTIKISKITAERLKNAKSTKFETYDEIINRIFDNLIKKLNNE